MSDPLLERAYEIRSHEVDNHCLLQRIEHVDRLRTGPFADSSKPVG